METSPSSEVMSFTLELVRYALYAFAVLATGLTIVAAVLFYKTMYSGERVGVIVQQTQIAKLATIVLIVMSVTLLRVLGQIDAEAVVAVLSGIAGYVLGDRGARQGRSAPDGE